MNNRTTQEHRAALREVILMGINRVVVAPTAAVYKTPGVYVEEIPSGVNG